MADFYDVFDGYASRLATVKEMTRSVSQLQSYQRCGYAYKRARVERVWSRPAAWFPLGTAVHSAMEAWEGDRSIGLAGAQNVFREHYVQDVNRYAAETPNLATWSWSGRYDGEADIERRFALGLEHVERLVEFYTTGKGRDSKLWHTPDGKPALELHFVVDIGGVKVQGYIDRVDSLSDGSLRCVDYKSGSKPGDVLQLQVYALVLQQEYGATVKDGAFLMSKDGKFIVHDLSDVDYDEVIGQFVAMDEGVKAEKFDPTDDYKVCERCDVNNGCPFFLGPGETR